MEARGGQPRHQGAGHVLWVLKVNKSLPGRQRTDVHWEGVCANVKTDVVRERTNRGRTEVGLTQLK